MVKVSRWMGDDEDPGDEHPQTYQMNWMSDNPTCLITVSLWMLSPVSGLLR